MLIAAGRRDNQVFWNSSSRGIRKSIRWGNYSLGKFFRLLILFPSIPGASSSFPLRSLSCYSNKVAFRRSRGWCNPKCFPSVLGDWQWAFQPLLIGWLV
jgi:hypothetical protein